MLWLAICYPDLPLEVFGRLPENPCVVAEQNRIWLANAAARSAGVQVGSTLATATTIAGQLEHHRRDPRAELNRLEVLAEALYQLTPQVALRPPDGLVLNIQASLRLFGDAGAMLERALRLSANLGHQGHARLGATPILAMALARTGVSTPETLPLSGLELDAATVERLQNMGLTRLGQLSGLPDSAIAQRFGKATLAQLRRLRGDLPDPQRYIELPSEFQRSQHLLNPIRNKQGLLFPMQRLLKELRHWLIAQQLAAGLLRWRFSNSQRERAVLEVQFGEPHQNEQRALKLSQLKLDTVTLPADVLSIELEALKLEPLRAETTNLFQQLEPGERNGCPGELLDLLRARLGQKALSNLLSLHQHHPDWLTRRVPAQPPEQPRSKPSRKTRRTAAAGHAQSPHPARSTESQTTEPQATEPQSTETQNTATQLPPGARYRPLWLCRPPQPVSLQQLELLQGPERIRTAWWHQGINRDYYIARHLKSPQQLSHCWTFVDDQGRWYIHGYFA
ncbi:MAG: DNA polymerase Y family protein [Pseudomonadota bacterium]